MRRSAIRVRRDTTMPSMIKTEENHKSIDWSTIRVDEYDKRPTWTFALQGRESMYRRMIQRRVGHMWLAWHVACVRLAVMKDKEQPKRHTKSTLSYMIKKMKQASHAMNTYHKIGFEAVQVHPDTDQKISHIFKITSLLWTSQTSGRQRRSCRGHWDRHLKQLSQNLQHRSYLWILMQVG